MKFYSFESSVDIRISILVYIGKDSIAVLETAVVEVAHFDGFEGLPDHVLLL